MVDHDEPQEDEWPNDDEANDIMLAYAAADDSRGLRSGCAGVFLVLTIISCALVWSMLIKL